MTDLPQFTSFPLFTTLSDEPVYVRAEHVRKIYRWKYKNEIGTIIIFDNDDFYVVVKEELEDVMRALASSIYYEGNEK